MDTPEPSCGRPAILDFPCHVDERGTLLEIDFRKLPFVPKRAFLVEGAEAGQVRGGHAHRDCQQLLVCVKGAINVECVDRTAAETHRLDSPSRALHVPERVWSRQVYLEPNSRLLVLASHSYDPGSYIAEPPEPPV